VKKRFACFLLSAMLLLPSVSYAQEQTGKASMPSVENTQDSGDQLQNRDENAQNPNSNNNDPTTAQKENGTNSQNTNNSVQNTSSHQENNNGQSDHLQKESTSPEQNNTESSEHQKTKNQPLEKTKNTVPDGNEIQTNSDNAPAKKQTNENKGGNKSSPSTLRETQRRSAITKNNTDDLNDYTGWVKIDGKWYYYQYGEKVTGLFSFFDDETGKDIYYFFDLETGEMRTGWVQYLGNYYYFDPNSGIMKTGWLMYNNKWYYLNDDEYNGNYGAMVTGLAHINENITMGQ
jgi:glucan-binding YG repeat protein